MRSVRRPPRLATALFDLMSPGAAAEELLGDLVEEFESGRSAAWYWRQVFGALLLDAWRSCRRHPWLALRGLALTSTVLWLLAWPVRIVVGAVFHEVVLTGLVSLGRWLVVAPWLMLPLDFAVGSLSGWTGARFSPRVLLPVMLACAFAYIMWNAGWTWTLLVNSALGPSRYWSATSSLIARQSAVVVGLFTGGLMAARRRLDTHVPD